MYLMNCWRRILPLLTRYNDDKSNGYTPKNIVCTTCNISVFDKIIKKSVLASGDSGTVPAITCDCSPVAELLMRRRYFDLCVTASSRTMLTFENNVSCSSRDCSTIAFCRR